MRFRTLLLFFLLPILTFAQIDKLEYYIDTDPGIGLATDIFTSGGFTINETFSVPTAAISTVGFHTLVVRSRDVSGTWSVEESRSFYVSASDLTTQANVVDVEYFIDTDPGYGAGTSLGAFASTTLDLNPIIPTNTLPAGFHVLYIRAQDSDGAWGDLESRSFYVSVSNLTTQANVVDVEYFIDTDPGYGAGISLGAFTATTLDINSVIPTNTLPVGFHTLYIRALDSDGAWGDLESRSFYVSASDLTTQANIVNVEYYIDTDPGYGAGNSLGAFSTATLDIDPIISTNTLPTGFHNLYIRAQDSDGVWSEVESRSFFVDNFGNGQLAGIEYFIDTDPGYGAGVNIPVSPAVDSIDNLVTIPTSTLLAGNYELGMRILDTNGNSSVTDYYNFVICATAVGSFSADTVCVGTATTFTDSSTGVLAGDVYSWDFDGDLVQDANTAGNQSFTYPLAGTYTAILSIDRAGCIDTASFQVVVVDLPMSNAGTDQTLCGVQNTTLAGSALANNEVGTWSLLSGVSTITAPNNPVTTITGITTNLVDLIWTVNNIFGNCISTDTVRLNTNLPITATSKIATIDIGQSLNIDVQAGAVINTGDVLSTSILNNPTNGIATVLANGTIDYVPNANALTSDIIVFQLCNQCSNCSSESVIITINNAAPSFTQTNIAPPIMGSKSTNLDLTTVISDPNGNIDFSSLTIVSQPISGATASIDLAGLLTIDYTFITFSGIDSLSIEVSDFSGARTIQTLTITIDVVAIVNPPIAIYNVVTPNGDGVHDFFKIGNIEAFLENEVIIYNRWGDKVYEFRGYDNASNVFNGISNIRNNTELDTGNYYYSIDRGDGSKRETGYLFLKR